MTADMSDLERVSSQHQKYFSLTVPEVLPSTVFIKSALGTGKTHQVIEFRDRIVGNAVIMSHRVTFTND
jgi:hypothetical protein